MNRTVLVSGLIVGAVGIAMLWAAGVDFPVAIPPGLVILLVGAAGVALVRRRWADGVGGLLGYFVLIGFLLAGINGDGFDSLGANMESSAWSCSSCSSPASGLRPWSAPRWCSGQVPTRPDKHFRALESHSTSTMTCNDVTVGLARPLSAPRCRDGSAARTHQRLTDPGCVGVSGARATRPVKIPGLVSCGPTRSSAAAPQRWVGTPYRMLAGDTFPALFRRDPHTAHVGPPFSPSQVKAETHMTWSSGAEVRRLRARGFAHATRGLEVCRRAGVPHGKLASDLRKCCWRLRIVLAVCGSVAPQDRRLVAVNDMSLVASKVVVAARGGSNSQLGVH